MLCLLALGAFFSGCATKKPGLVSPMMASAEYAAKEPITTSLFPSDQDLNGIVGAWVGSPTSGGVTGWG